MSSRHQPPTHPTGAHRARSRSEVRRRTPAHEGEARGPEGTGAAHEAEPSAAERGGEPRGGGGPGGGGEPRDDASHTPARDRDEEQLDGLFTYCLSVLCDHEQAVDALADVLRIAGRRRGPAIASERRAWLYALARWSCLRALTEARRKRQGAHAAPHRSAGRTAAGGEARTRRSDGSARCASTGTGAGGEVGAVAGDATEAGAQLARGTVAGAQAVHGAASGAQVVHGAASGAQPKHGTEPGARVAHPTESGARLAHAAEPGAGIPPEAESMRRRELALLAWPEAAGTTSEQREALELSVRHRLSPHEVAAVLGLDRIATRELLASAACEVERTRAALAVVERGTCPTVARLTGDHQLLLGTALRRELVRHVDDCPRCRRTAERAVPGAWPGTSVDPALPLVPAPRIELRALGLYASGGGARMSRAHRAPRSARRGTRYGEPRFDRRGFPMDPKDRAARRERLRARALTSTVVAAVIAAPVVALWAAYRGAPLTGEGSHGPSAAAGERGGPGETPADYENAGSARTATGTPFSGDRRAADVSVEVISSGAPPSESDAGPGRLSVDARTDDGLTLITLRASGGAPVRWSAEPSAPWLLLSRTSGTLEPGESLTIRVHVDRAREPAGAWRATVALAPSGALVSVSGHGRWRPPPPRPSSPGTWPPHSSTPPASPTPPRPTEPTSPPPSDTTQPSTPPPTDPDPTPTPSDTATGTTAPGDSPPPTGGTPSH